MAPGWSDPSGATEPATLDAVWKSIQTQRKNASEFVIPKNMALEYTIEMHYPIEPADLAALRAKVQDKPDHPARQDIRMYEEYLRDGPRHNIVHIWMTTDGLCRYNADYPYSDVLPFVDSAIGRDTSWSFSPTLLSINDPSDTSSSTVRDPGRAAWIARQEAARILYGPFWYYGEASAEQGDLNVSGTKWSLRVDVTGHGGGTVNLHGFWDSHSESSVATEAVLTDGPDVPNLLISVRAREWQYNDTLKLWIPGIVESDSGPNEYRVAIIRSATPVSTQEVEALTTTPSIDRPDPIRGELGVNSIYDYRPGSDSDIPLPADGLAHTQGSTGMNSLKVLQWSAYATAAALGCLLVVLRVRSNQRL